MTASEQGARLSRVALIAGFRLATGSSGDRDQQQAPTPQDAWGGAPMSGSSAIGRQCVTAKRPTRVLHLRGIQHSGHVDRLRA